MERDKAVRTANSVRSSTKALSATLGEKRLDEIDYKCVDGYITARLKLQRRPRTVAIEVAALRSCLVYAVACGDLKVMPTLPTVRQKGAKPHRCFTPEQCVALLEALRPLSEQPHVVTRGAPPICRDRLTYLAVLLALNLGMRKGEILSRSWEDLDRSQGPHGTLIVGPQPTIGFEVKTRRTRALPLTPEVRAELDRAHAEAGCPSSGWIFPSPVDGSKPRKDFYTALRRACKRAGLPAIHPHGLRHSWTTRLAIAGVDRRTLIELGGWSNGEMLDDIYAHTSDTHKADVMAKSGLAPTRPVPEGRK